MDGAALFEKREWASAGVEILFIELLPTCVCFPPPIFYLCMAKAALASAQNSAKIIFVM